MRNENLSISEFRSRTIKEIAVKFICMKLRSYTDSAGVIPIKEKNTIVKECISLATELFDTKIQEL